MEPKETANDPQAEYSRRLKLQQRNQAVLEQRHRRFGAAKLALAAAALVAFVWDFATRAVPFGWFAAPMIAYVCLEIAHGRSLRALRRCERVTGFYERGLARLENRWMGSGESGDEFQDAAHAYSRDLDLFGKGSVFEYLCTARTRAGREKLAKWLLGPAAVLEIRRRQAAISELAPRLDLREDLAVFGEDLRSQVRPKALTAWAEERAPVNPVAGRAVARVLAMLWLLSLAVWGVWGLWEVAVVASAVNLGFAAVYSARVRGIVPAEKFAQDFELLCGVLERIEREKFAAPKLAELQETLKTDGEPPSGSIERIRRLVQSLESRRNLMVRFVDPLLLWTTQIAFGIEMWRRKFGPKVKAWVEAVGEMEALCALSGYTYEHPNDVFAEFAEGQANCEAEGLAHPLIPEAQAVRNDFRLGDGLRLMIISGPNMAGKSTFIRAVGTNAVLAQCGAPVRARKLSLSPLQVTASICVLDSLQGGVSRFYAEITRLKVIAELAKGPLPVLFLLDELLAGTNSNDRRTGAEAVLRNLAAQDTIGFITTHDLALTKVTEEMNGKAANFHFEDYLKDGELRFDYKLVAGVASSSNALKLMRSIGLDV